MKKSFKKAGAAVLSMAMLLSMGAISMPVFAAPDTLPTHGKVTPTQVAVTIVDNEKTGDKDNKGTGSKHADDALHEYDYLETVDKAKVTMYRVATLETSGWQWDPAITTISDPTFAQLLEKVTITDNTTTPPTTGAPTELTPANEIYPALDSDTLQALAGKLQQIATSEGSTVPKIAEAEIHKLADGTFETVYLPNDNTLFSGPDAGNNTTTKNKIGYYLLVTDTDDVGYVMQPVLIPISNTVNGAADQRAVKQVSIKGVKVNVDKSIEDIYTKTDKNDKALFDSNAKEATDKIYESTGGKNISTDKNSGVIDADDIIMYQIMADVPRYSKDASPSGYKITDEPETGINIISRVDENNNYVTGVQATGAQSTNGEIKLYWSADDELITTQPQSGTYVVDTPLEEGTDYTLASYNTGGGQGFVVSFDADQLRGKGTGSAMANKTMEGGHIFVVFKAKTDDNFKTDYSGPMPTKTTATLDNANMTWKELYDKYDTVIGGLDATTKTALKTKIAKADFLTAVSSSKIVEEDSKTESTVYGKYDITDTDNDTMEDLLIAAYLVLSDKQKTFDDQYANALKTFRDGNGTTNTAKVTYKPKFTYEGDDETVEDKTNLYAVTLNLTKKAVENKVLAQTTNSTRWVKSLTISTETIQETGTATNPYKATVGGTEKIVWANTDGTRFSTDFSDVATGDPAVAKYVTALETSDNATPAAVTITGATVTTPPTLYVNKVDTKFASTTDVNEAKVVAVDTGVYTDGFEHSKPVQGAVFQLEEKFSTVTAANQRLGGDEGTHARGMAISDKDGKFWYIEKNASTTNTKPTLEATIDNTIQNDSTKIVYYTVDDSVSPAVYTTYYVTNKPAWDRVGEGTYQLREIYAPAGYKQWKTPSEFTITAEKDASGNLTGKFEGSASVNTFWAEDPDGTYSQRADGEHLAVFTQNVGTGASATFENEILNEPDDTLPATGGIGTVLFTAGGISIVLIAGALFVMYMKKRNAEDEE